MNKIKFLNEQENEIIDYLDKAQDIFRELTVIDPQHPTDLYNFGHYLDAARCAVIMRGARRLDPDALLPKRDKIGSNAAEVLKFPANKY